MKKLLFLSSLFVSSFVHAINQEVKPKKRYVVYSHGYGERGGGKDYYSFLGDDCSAPLYPDAPEYKGQVPQFNKSVFYTKPAVHTLANHLNKVAHKDDCESIVLAGNSCGAGTASNCLALLVNYEENIDYFEDSEIASQEDAQNIMAKINKGAYIETAPLMNLGKAHDISRVSALLTGVTIAASTAVAYAALGSECILQLTPVKVGCLVAGAVTYYLVGDLIKNAYTAGIVRYAVPYLTNYSFDPHHPDPQESVEKLRGKLTCPILLQFHEQDGLLANPDEDTIKRYDALKGEKTHIIITNDASHNRRSEQFKKVLEDFDKQLKGQPVEKQATQPTVQQLRQQIFAKKIILKKMS